MSEVKLKRREISITDIVNLERRVELLEESVEKLTNIVAKQADNTGKILKSLRQIVTHWP